ncbi:hypothetical protein D3C80_1960080 [compost metagenome]
MAQQFFCLLQPRAHHKLMWCQARVMFEHPGKMELTQPCLCRQVCQQQRLVEMLLNILFHPFGDRRSQTAADLR